MSDEGADYASRSQQISILLVQGFSSCLSLFGSISIIYIIVRNTKHESSMFHRLMLGLSIGDTIASLGFLLAPYLQPDGDESLLAASGNTASCSFAAVLLYTLVSNCFYNCAIAIFYHQTIRVGQREEILSKSYEKWMHLVSISSSVSVNIIALSLEAYNPSEAARICTIESVPAGCNRNDNLECTRGDFTAALSYAVLSLITIPAVTGIILTILVYLYVNKMYHKTKQYRYEGEARESRRKRQITKQAVVYCYAFVNSFVWGLSLFIVERVTPGNIRTKGGKPGVFLYMWLYAFFFPLQGFINFLVYTRPRYWKNRERFPNESSLYALAQVYTSNETIRNNDARSRSQQKTSNGASRFWSRTKRLSTSNDTLSPNSATCAELRSAPEEEEEASASIFFDDCVDLEKETVPAVETET